MANHPPDPPNNRVRAARVEVDPGTGDVRVSVAHDPGSKVDLRDTTRRWVCPECGARVQRLPTGRMRYHGATRTRGRACGFPALEAGLMATEGGARDLAGRYPEWSDLYRVWLADLTDRAARNVPKRHGGQLRHPDPRDPGWRWRRG